MSHAEPTAPPDMTAQPRVAVPTTAPHPLTGGWNVALLVMLGLTNAGYAAAHLTANPARHTTVILLTAAYVLLGTVGWHLLHTRAPYRRWHYTYFATQFTLVGAVYLMLVRVPGAAPTPALAWGLFVHAAALSLRGRWLVWGLTTACTLGINARPPLIIPYLLESLTLFAAFGALGVVRMRQIALRTQVDTLLETARQDAEHDREAFHNIQRIRQQFFSSATHDMKNPLSTIYGYVQMLETHGDHDASSRHYIAMIYRSIDKLHGLLNDILILTQLEVQPALQRTVFPVNRLLFNTAADFQLQAEDKNITLQIVPTAHNDHVLADAARLQRALDNLVSNAIKYTPDGGRVRVAVTADEGFVTIAVSDNGVGIPPEALPRLFDSFYRVDQDTVRDIEGSGLGLAIVKTTVEQHGGTVSASSNREGGTTFTLRLPRNG